jgi:segregation and condensation protein B
MQETEVKLAPEAEGQEQQSTEEAVSEQLVIGAEAPVEASSTAHIKAIIEAVVYITDEPLSAAQIAAALGQPAELVAKALDELAAEYNRPEHGLTVREVAGGYKMATKPEHHEAVRDFVKSLKPPLKLSLPALETLAVIAYKQPVTGPEIQEIRGVQGSGVMKTLLERRLIAEAGRKNVVGRPMLFKTTKEFLIQFGLKDLTELPSLKEFEEIRRMAFNEGEAPPEPPEAQSELPLESTAEPAAEPASEDGAETAPDASAEPPQES